MRGVKLDISKQKKTDLGIIRRAEGEFFFDVPVSHYVFFPLSAIEKLF